MKLIRSDKGKTLLFLCIISVIVFLGVKYLLPYFLPFIFAYWLAKYTYPIAYFMNQKFHLPMGIAGILTLLLCTSLIGLTAFFFTDAFIRQATILFHNLPAYKDTVLSHANDICLCCDKFLKNRNGTTFDFLGRYLTKLFGNATSKIIPCITMQTITIMKRAITIVTTSFIILFSALLIMIDMNSLKELYKKCLFYEDLNQILKQLSQTGVKYLKIQCFIVCIIAGICTAGLFFNKSSYPLLIGIIIAILDALPLFGSGTILIPWAVIKLFSHNIIGAVILVSTYILCQMTRQFLESRLLGDTLGLAPIYFVMSLFIGIELFGLTGVILGPFSVLLIKTLYRLYKPDRFNESLH